jgi:uncharacterized membrane protein
MRSLRVTSESDRRTISLSVVWISAAWTTVIYAVTSVPDAAPAFAIAVCGVTT